MENSAPYLNKKQLRKSCGRISYNNTIAGYYRNLADGIFFEYFTQKANSIGSCFKVWNIDFYNQQKVRDIKMVNRCRDKFCKNCQAALSMARYDKFSPILNDYAEEYAVYHCTFTVPNPLGKDLKTVIDQMYSKFPLFVGLLKGARKVSGIDFLKYGYQGCVRSFEVTVKKEKGEVWYHPHFHCYMIFKKNLKNTGKYYNSFSDRGGKRKIQPFTDMDILFQKVWYLIYNNIRVTKNAIDDLKEGYSCLARKVRKGDYKEVFKYTLKESFQDLVSSEEIFNTLRVALHGRRIIQGYGCLYDINFETDDLEDLVDEMYINKLIELNRVESPDNKICKLQEISESFNEENPVKFISKAGYRKYVLKNG